MLGPMVESSVRPQTLAQYYATVQRKVARVSVVPCGESLGLELPVNSERFSIEELRGVLRRRKKGKSSGEDGVQPEYLHALLADNEALLQLLSLLNHCWEGQDISDAWRCAQVIHIFKKGD